MVTAVLKSRKYENSHFAIIISEIVQGNQKGEKFSNINYAVS